MILICSFGSIICFPLSKLNEQNAHRSRAREGLDLNIRVQRIALTHQQVQEYNLTPNPTKSADPRATGYTEQFGNQCWELDAIEPNELQRLVSESIKSHIDADIWNQTLEQQTQERQELEEQFSAIEQLLREHEYL